MTPLYDASEIESLLSYSPTMAESLVVEADELREMALFYASEYAWPVFPCKPGEKVPITVNGFKAATTDANVIREWWDRWPLANIGIATGSPGPDVLDIDVKPGSSGWAAWRDLLSINVVAAPMFTARTRNGGAHMYYAGSQSGNRSFKVQHIDIRAAGGYVLAPPSFVLPDADTPGTGTYDWKAPGRGFLAARGPHLNHTAVVAAFRSQESAVPERIAAWLRDKHDAVQGGGFVSTAGLHDVVREAQPGNRNNALFWALATLYAEAPQMGLSHEESTRMIQSSVDNGLSTREAYRTAVSAWRKAHGAGK